MVDIRKMIKYARTNGINKNIDTCCYYYDKVTDRVLPNQEAKLLEQESGLKRRVLPMPKVAAIEVMDSFIAIHSKEIDLDREISELSGMDYISALRWALHDSGLLSEYDTYYMNVLVNTMISWCETNEIEYTIKSDDDIRNGELG